MQPSAALRPGSVWYQAGRTLSFRHQHGTQFITRDHSRKRYSMKYYACYLALVLISATAFAGSPESFDWPQWQGPDRNAVSKERSLLKEWTKDGPPLVWKIKGLGGGDSAPSIAAGRIFGMGN